MVEYDKYALRAQAMIAKYGKSYYKNIGKKGGINSGKSDKHCYFFKSIPHDKVVELGSKGGTRKAEKIRAAKELAKLKEEKNNEQAEE